MNPNHMHSFLMYSLQVENAVQSTYEQVGVDSITELEPKQVDRGKVAVARVIEVQILFKK